eukprot:16465_1
MQLALHHICGIDKTTSAKLTAYISSVHLIFDIVTDWLVTIGWILDRDFYKYAVFSIFFTLMTNYYTTVNVWRTFAHKNIKTCHKAIAVFLGLIGAGYCTFVYNHYLSKDLENLSNECNKQISEEEQQNIYITTKIRVGRIQFIRCILLSMPTGLLQLFFIITDESNSTNMSHIIVWISLVSTILSFGSSISSWIYYQIRRLQILNILQPFEITWIHSTVSTMFFATDYVNRTFVLCLLLNLTVYGNCIWYIFLLIVFCIICVEVICNVIMIKYWKKHNKVTVRGTYISAAFHVSASVFSSYYYIGSRPYSICSHYIITARYTLNILLFVFYLSQDVAFNKWSIVFIVVFSINLQLFTLWARIQTVWFQHFTGAVAQYNNPSQVHKYEDFSLNFHSFGQTAECTKKTKLIITKQKIEKSTEPTQHTDDTTTFTYNALTENVLEETETIFESKMEKTDTCFPFIHLFVPYHVIDVYIVFRILLDTDELLFGKLKIAMIISACTFIKFSFYSVLKQRHTTTRTIDIFLGIVWYIYWLINSVLNEHDKNDYLYQLSIFHTSAKIASLFGSAIFATIWLQRSIEEYFISNVADIILEIMAAILLVFTYDVQCVEWWFLSLGFTICIITNFKVYQSKHLMHIIVSIKVVLLSAVIFIYAIVGIITYSYLSEYCLYHDIYRTSVMILISIVALTFPSLAAYAASRIALFSLGNKSGWVIIGTFGQIPVILINCFGIHNWEMADCYVGIHKLLRYASMYILVMESLFMIMDVYSFIHAFTLKQITRILFMTIKTLGLLGMFAALIVASAIDSNGIGPALNNRREQYHMSRLCQQSVFGKMFFSWIIINWFWLIYESLTSLVCFGYELERPDSKADKDNSESKPKRRDSLDDFFDKYLYNK